jgi:hypothetical protein
VEQALLVGGPPGLEDLVVDLAAVDLDLVDAVGGREEGGAPDGRVEVEGPPDQRRLRPLRRVVEADHAGRPRAVGEEARHDGPGLAPRREPAVRAGDADADLDALAGGERSHRPGHEDPLGTVEAHRPDVGRAADLDLGRGLLPARGVRPHDPRQAGGGHGDGVAVGRVLRGDADDAGAVGAHGHSSPQGSGGVGGADVSP